MVFPITQLLLHPHLNAVPQRIVPLPPDDEVGTECTLRSVAHVVRDRDRGSESIGGRLHTRYAPGQDVGKGGKIRHRRCLCTVAIVLNHHPIAAGLQIDEVGHIACGDAQTKGVAFDRRAFDELVMSPDRGDGRELVNSYISRPFGTDNRQQCDGRVVGARLVLGGLAARCQQIQARARRGRRGCA